MNGVGAGENVGGIGRTGVGCGLGVGCTGTVAVSIGFGPVLESPPAHAHALATIASKSNDAATLNRRLIEL